ncbi:FAD/NAD(P)-binding domain-protein [Echria macrotheca]|uniref:FAD/NAD(P)-binding domain-protein n=1 Tax=Echria macrotheca TaxID=438768 RepID=A0AAJ0F7N9_9PEZI|nr:FAD/NAD(P)-binding domain-protein [Echria macrotheca]
MTKARVKSVAIIGAGAAGAVTAAAFKAENYYERIRVFERREIAGGTWIYDAEPPTRLPIHPGGLAPEIDPPLQIPTTLPHISPPNVQERYFQTPIYSSLTTNVPDIAMCFSDRRFAYGPFAPHYVPRQYIENYFSSHETDKFLELGTTVEDLSLIPTTTNEGGVGRWKLTLRKYDPIRRVDIWWEETFDAVVLANGHYSVPYIPHVKGLSEFIANFPNRVIHSKLYRSPQAYSSKKVLVIGNSASGHDITSELVSTASLPVYQSRRTPSRWDGPNPPKGIEWKPTVKEYTPSGRIIFSDDTYAEDIDTIIYCTGYQPSFPFWNATANGRPLYDYTTGRLSRNYWHTFFQDFPTLGIVGMPRALTFRSFEYQAIALARLWAGRNTAALPPVADQKRWENERAERTRREGKKFHDVPWDDGETHAWLGRLFEIAGLGTLGGDGMIPPVLGRDIVWAIDNVKKYPDPGKEKREGDDTGMEEGDDGWIVVGREKDSLAFI